MKILIIFLAFFGGVIVFLSAEKTYYCHLNNEIDESCPPGTYCDYEIPHNKLANFIMKNVPFPSCPTYEQSYKLSPDISPYVAPSTSGCPPFLDCMPGPDLTTPCVVPSGCKDYTQIVQ